MENSLSSWYLLRKHKTIGLSIQVDKDEVVRDQTAISAVNGKIALELEEQTNIKCLTLSISCILVLKYGSEREEQTLWRDELHWLHPGNGHDHRTHAVKAGLYAFAFHFTVPDDLPPSLVLPQNYAQVSYCLRLSCHRPFFFPALKISREVKVSNLLCYDQRIPTTVIVQDRAFRSGFLSCKVLLPDQSFYSGESVTMSVELNTSKHVLKVYHISMRILGAFAFKMSGQWNYSENVFNYLRYPIPDPSSTHTSSEDKQKLERQRDAANKVPLGVRRPLYHERSESQNLSGEISNSSPMQVLLDFTVPKAIPPSVNGQRIYMNYQLEIGIAFCSADYMIRIMSKKIPIQIQRLWSLKPVNAATALEQHGRPPSPLPPYSAS